MELLTGKNREQFGQYCLKTFNWFKTNREFLELPFEMQIGVYLAYYDSLEIDIDVLRWEKLNFYFVMFNEDNKILLTSNGKKFKSRNKAYKGAFKKANEIINN